MDLFRFMDRAVELGLDGIQIDPMHLERTDPDYLAQIVAYAGQRNLYIEYGTTGIEAGHLLEQPRIAHELGSPILRTYIGFNPREVADVRQEVTYALAQLEQVKPRAEEYRIKIAIENHCDLKTDELLDLVQRANSPFIGVCVDLGKGSIDLKAIADILINESKLDRIMLELPVEKEATEAATLKKEDDCVVESVAYARNVLLKDYN